jgi:hypothetical protein
MENRDNIALKRFFKLIKNLLNRYFSGNDEDLHFEAEV